MSVTNQVATAAVELLLLSLLRAHVVDKKTGLLEKDEVMQRLSVDQNTAHTICSLWAKAKLEDV